MVTVRFSQNNTTWYEDVELTYTNIYNLFRDIGNPNNENYVEYEIYDDDTFYAKGQFPLLCDEEEDSEFWIDIDEAQNEAIQNIIKEI